MPTRRGSFIAYFLLTFGITWGIAAMLLLFPAQIAAWFGEMSAHHPLFFLAVWAPTIAALIVTTSTQGVAGLRVLLSRLVRWRFSIQWYLFVLLGIPVLGLCAAALGGGTPVYGLQQWYLYVPLLLSQIFLDPGSLGEELGWRGFALPYLLRERSPLVASLILGIIWFVWHLPAFFISGAPQVALSLPAFFISALALSILATWLFTNTRGSILPSVILHLTANFALNMLDAPLVTFGILLTIAALLVLAVTHGTLVMKRIGLRSEEERVMG